jgi:hypothetical protein
MDLPDSFLKLGKEIMPDTQETQISLYSPIDPQKSAAFLKIQSSDMTPEKH